MEKFIGVKLINAEPMTRLAYNELRGWPLPADENGEDDGYLVEYINGGKANHPNYSGYISWSPADVFERAYRPTAGMNFGLALEALKAGHRVARTGWNGARQWVALGAGNDALPAANFWNEHTRQFAEENGGAAAVRPYFILKTAQNDILMGWSPSQSDALADDWAIV